jgi:hypothetical protein
MKVNQIVSEHKKGVRAMKYTKKTKGTVPVYGPDSTDAKLKPVKPVGASAKLDEQGVEVKPMPGASQVSVNGKPIATTDAATAQAISQAAEKGQFTTTDGTEQATTETGHEIGGDPTDKWIKDITLDDEIGDKPYYVDNSSGKPMIKSGNGLTPVQPSKMWTQISPEVIAKATSQGFRQINISVNGQILKGFEGGGKVIVSPTDFATMSGVKEVQSPFPSRNPGTPAADAAAQAAAQPPKQHQSVMPSRNKVQEADDVLLGKMLAIAGLR